MEAEEDHWLVEELRNLRRSGSSGSGGSSGSKSGSYGNCYGDRCDNIGGDRDIAIVIGCIVAGCCLTVVIYMVVSYCQK